MYCIQHNKDIQRKLKTKLNKFLWILEPKAKVNPVTIINICHFSKFMEIFEAFYLRLLFFHICQETIAIIQVRKMTAR